MENVFPRGKFVPEPIRPTSAVDQFSELHQLLGTNFDPAVDAGFAGFEVVADLCIDQRYLLRSVNHVGKTLHDVHIDRFRDHQSILSAGDTLDHQLGNQIRRHRKQLVRVDRRSYKQMLDLVPVQHDQHPSGVEQEERLRCELLVNYRQKTGAVKQKLHLGTVRRCHEQRMVCGGWRLLFLQRHGQESVQRPQRRNRVEFKPSGHI
mmetsp:Transcript_4176/g.6529  ORF Transcript_4176/g.6529 Transcript_4176/m.6529 type:complete len:206 (+) Transcript_4176:852-1469(+)